MEILRDDCLMIHKESRGFQWMVKGKFFDGRKKILLKEKVISRFSFFSLSFSLSDRVQGTFFLALMFFGIVGISWCCGNLA